MSRQPQTSAVRRRSSRCRGSLSPVLAALALMAGSAMAQDLEPARIDVSELGPQVGEVVPDFSLPDQTGVIRTRESIMGPRGAMLVFVRSADW
jgi:hypothetical protein